MRTRALSSAAVFGVIVAVATACGSASNAVSTSRSGSSTPPPASSPVASPSATPTLTVPTPAPTGPTGASAAADLQTFVAAAPAGYHLSTDSDADIGPIAARDFNEEEGSGAAATLGFVTGWSTTYDADASDDSVEYDLFQFASGAQAAAYLNLVVHELVASDPTERPVTTTVPGLPGAIGIDSTVVAKDGDDFGVAARDDRMVVLTDLEVDDVRTAYRSVAATYARAQMARLDVTAAT